MTIFRQTFAWPFVSAQAPRQGLISFVGAVRDAPRLEDELFFAPVVVVDVGAVEAVDHLGGACADLDGLEDS